VKEDEMGRACSTKYGKEGCIYDFGGKARYRWVDNIKIYLRERVWDGTDWIDVAEGRDR
jgi:hypothetical protein